MQPAVVYCCCVRKIPSLWRGESKYARFVRQRRRRTTTAAAANEKRGTTMASNVTHVRIKPQIFLVLPIVILILVLDRTSSTLNISELYVVILRDSRGKSAQQKYSIRLRSSHCRHICTAVQNNIPGIMHAIQQGPQKHHSSLCTQRTAVTTTTVSAFSSITGIS